MKQTKLQSLREILISTGIGFGVAYISQLIIFPLLGYDVPARDNLIIGSFFTVVSIIRGYIVRRVSDWWQHRKLQKKDYEVIDHII